MSGRWESHQSDYSGVWHVCFRTTDGIYPEHLDFEIGQGALARAMAVDLNRIEVRG